MKAMLKKAREAKGLKVKEVAGLLHIDQALISKFESGQRRPTKNQVLQLAQLLEIDTKTILTAWLAEKILHEIDGEELALEALKAAQSKISGETLAGPSIPVDKLLQEMDLLRAMLLKGNSEK